MGGPRPGLRSGSWGHSAVGEEEGVSGGSPHLQPRPSLGSPRGPSGHFLLAGHILVPALWNHVPPRSWNQPSTSHRPPPPQSWPLPKPSSPKSAPPALAGRTPGQRSEEGSEPPINAPGPLWGLPDFMLPNPAQAPRQMQRKMQRAEGMVSLGSAMEEVLVFSQSPQC